MGTTPASLDDLVKNWKPQTSAAPAAAPATAAPGSLDDLVKNWKPGAQAAPAAPAPSTSRPPGESPYSKIATAISQPQATAAPPVNVAEESRTRALSFPKGTQFGFDTSGKQAPAGYQIGETEIDPKTGKPRTQTPLLKSPNILIRHPGETEIGPQTVTFPEQERAQRLKEQGKELGKSLTNVGAARPPGEILGAMKDEAKDAVYQQLPKDLQNLAGFVKEFKDTNFVKEATGKTFSEHYDTLVGELKKTATENPDYFPPQIRGAIMAANAAPQSVKDFAVELGRFAPGIMDFFSTPEGIAAGMLPIGAGGNPIVERLISAGFSADMVPAAVESIQESIDHPSPENFARALTSTWMAYGVTRHAVKPFESLTRGEGDMPYQARSVTPPSLTPGEKLKESLSEHGPKAELLGKWRKAFAEAKEDLKADKALETEAAAIEAEREGTIVAPKSLDDLVKNWKPGAAPAAEVPSATPKEGGPSARPEAQPAQGEVIPAVSQVGAPAKAAETPSEAPPAPATGKTSGELWESVVERAQAMLAQQHPDWGISRLQAEAAKYVGPKPAPESTSRPPAKAEAPTVSLTPSGNIANNSWTIVDKATGRGVRETFDPSLARNVNTEKYAFVPTDEYLQETNRRIKAAGGVQPPDAPWPAAEAPVTTPPPGEPQAEAPKFKKGQEWQAPHGDYRVTGMSADGKVEYEFAPPTGRGKIKSTATPEDFANMMANYTEMTPKAKTPKAEAEPAKPPKAQKPAETEYRPPEGAPKQWWPVKRNDYYVLTDGSITFGTRGTFEDLSAKADTHNLEAKQGLDADAAEKAKYPKLNWDKSTQVKAIKGEAGFARFLGEAKQVGKIPQAYGHDEAVYEWKGKLVRVSKERLYSKDRTVHPVVGDEADAVQFAGNKAARDAKERLGPKAAPPKAQERKTTTPPTVKEEAEPTVVPESKPTVEPPTAGEPKAGAQPTSVTPEEYEGLRRKHLLDRYESLEGRLASLDEDAMRADPASYTPDNLPVMWASVTKEIMHNDPSLSPARAGELAAARIRNHMMDVMKGLEDRADKPETFTPSETKLMENFYGETNPWERLIDLSESRTLLLDMEEPEAQRSMTAERLPDVLGERMAKAEELRLKARAADEAKAKRLEEESQRTMERAKEAERERREAAEAEKRRTEKFDWYKKRGFYPGGRAGTSEEIAARTESMQRQKRDIAQKALDKGEALPAGVVEDFPDLKKTAEPPSTPSASEFGTKERAETLKQMLEDNIALRKSKGEAIPQGWYDKLAAVSAHLKGETIEPDTIGVKPVFGHPEYTSDPRYVDLLPLRAKPGMDLSWRFKKAQKIVDELSAKLGMAEARVKGRVKATPKEKKEAQSYLASANADRERDVRDSILKETLPELNRLQGLVGEKTDTPPGIKAETSANEPPSATLPSKEPDLDPIARRTLEMAQKRLTNLNTPETLEIASAIAKIGDHKGPLRAKDVAEAIQYGNKDGLEHVALGMNYDLKTGSPTDMGDFPETALQMPRIADDGSVIEPGFAESSTAKRAQAIRDELGMPPISDKVKAAYVAALETARKDIEETRMMPSGRAKQAGKIAVIDGELARQGKPHVSTETPPGARTTPANGTPERTKLEADYEAGSTKQSAIWDEQRKLETEIAASKYGSKKRESLEKRLAKNREQERAASATQEPLRRQSYLADLEDAAEQTENPILQMAAKYGVEEQNLKALQGTSKFDVVRQTKHNEDFKTTHDAIRAELRKRVDDADAKDIDARTKQQIEELTPEENKRAVESAVRSVATDYMTTPLRADDIDRSLRGSLYGEREDILKSKFWNNLNDLAAEYDKVTGTQSSSGTGGRAFRELRDSVDKYGKTRAEALDAGRKLIEDAKAQKQNEVDARNKVTEERSSSVRPLSEMKVPAINETAGNVHVWDGNSVKGGDLASDGSLMVDLAAVKDKTRRAQLSKQKPGAGNPSETAKKIWDQVAKSAKTALEDVGYITDKGVERALYAKPDGTIIALGGKKARFLQSALGFDEVRGSDAGKPVALYRDGKMVGVLSPYPFTGDIDLGIARESAKKPLASAEPPGVATPVEEAPPAPAPAEPPAQATAASRPWQKTKGEFVGQFQFKKDAYGGLPWHIYPADAKEISFQTAVGVPVPFGGTAAYEPGVPVPRWVEAQNFKSKSAAMDALNAAHRRMVEQAQTLGDPVPENVLSEYGLKPKADAVAPTAEPPVSGESTSRPPDQTPTAAQEPWQFTRDEYENVYRPDAIKYNPFDAEGRPDAQVDNSTGHWERRDGMWWKEGTPGFMGGSEIRATDPRTIRRLDHEVAVKAAHAAGKPVPANVLAEYGLQPKTATPPGDQTPTAEGKTETPPGGDSVTLGGGLGALQPAYEAAAEAARKQAEESRIYQETIKPAIEKWAGNSKKAFEIMRKAIDPRGVVDRPSLDLIYKLKGGRDMLNWLMDQQLKHWEGVYDGLTPREMVESIDRVKQGLAQAGKDAETTRQLQDSADFMRGVEDATWQRLHEIADLNAYDENHRRVMWKEIPTFGRKQPEGAQRGMLGVSKSNLAGTKGYMKRRFFDDFTEGLAWSATRDAESITRMAKESSLIDHRLSKMKMLDPKRDGLTQRKAQLDKQVSDSRSYDIKAAITDAMKWVPPDQYRMVDLPHGGVDIVPYSNKAIEALKRFKGPDFMPEVFEKRGGTPTYWNPLVAFKANYADNLKYLTIREYIEDSKKRGMAQFVKKGAGPRPEGFEKINDAVTKAYFKAPTSKLLKEVQQLVNDGKASTNAEAAEMLSQEYQQKGQDFKISDLIAPSGEWYMEKGAALLLNRMVSPDYIRGNILGQTLVGMKNGWTAIELGASPFHLVFEANETTSSMMGIAFRELYMAAGKAGVEGRFGMGLDSRFGLKRRAALVQAGQLAKQGLKDIALAPISGIPGIRRIPGVGPLSERLGLESVRMEPMGASAKAYYGEVGPSFVKERALAEQIKDLKAQHSRMRKDNPKRQMVQDQIDRLDVDRLAEQKKFDDATTAFQQTPAGAALLKRFPNAHEIVHDYFMGGGKLHMDESYRIRAGRTFLEAYKEARKQGEIPTQLLNAIPAMNEQLLRPLFDVYIPNLKLAVFMRDYSLGKLENEGKLRRGELSRQELARRSVDLVEDRFGEMNFDNMFWHNTMKTAAQILIRSTTWQWGNLRGTGKALRGVWRTAKDIPYGIKHGEAPTLDPATAWFAGVVVWSTLQSTAMSSILGGQSPAETFKKIAGGDWTQIAYPVIDKTGSRVKVQTYLPTWIHASRDPMGWLTSILAGDIGRTTELVRNKDFFNTEIAHPGDPLHRRVLDRVGHMFPLPISFQAARQAFTEGRSPQAIALGMAGFGKAPSSVEQTPAEQMAAGYSFGTIQQAPRTSQDAAHSRLKSQFTNRLRRGEDISYAVFKAMQEGQLNDRDVHDIETWAGQPNLLRHMTRITDPEQLLDVWEKSSDEEKMIIVEDVAKKLDSAYMNRHRAFEDRDNPKKENERIMRRVAKFQKWIEDQTKAQSPTPEPVTAPPPGVPVY